MIDEGDFITLIFDDQESSMTPVNIPIKIAYKDDDMMVIDKDYGLSVMSTINLHEDTFEPFCGSKASVIFLRKQSHVLPDYRIFIRYIIAIDFHTRMELHQKLCKSLFLC